MAYIIITEREQKVLAMREEGKTLKAIGKELGVTPERIRQIEAKAELKMKVLLGEVVLGEK